MIILILLANVIIFWQFYFRHLLPFPGDLLVSFFFPWNSGGFVGFDQWTTHKEVIAADVVRQMFPWKSFAFDLIRQGHWPLWNPYNFSGYPLIANLQSSIFFPGNILFLFLPTLWAWIGLVISLPIVLSFFMYLFLRSLKLSVLSSVFGAIVAANLGYIVVWHEQLIITQVALFLPILLWSVNRYLDTRKVKYLLVLSFGIAGAIFGGHAQTFIYVLIIFLTYLIFRRVSLKVFLPFLILGFMLGAVQLLPTAEIYLHSAREGEATRRLFAPFILSWPSLATIFAPDFFGNPATGNFWGQHYGDFQVYFGVVALVFSILAVFCCFLKREVKFFFVLGILGLLFALWPLVYVPHILNIPIMATGVPARILFIFQFSMAVLAAYGFDYWQKGKRERPRELLALAFLGIIYFLFWLFVFFGHKPEALITRSNLILPTLTFFLAVAASRFRRHMAVLGVILILLAIGEYSYLFNKYQPFAPAKFVFPSHPVFRFLQDKAGIDRFFGFGTAYVDNNFATYYRVFASEGWDSLYIKRYGQLLASAKDGRLAQEILRSDALFPLEDNVYRNRLFDLLGIKYILDKNDNPKSNWEPEPDKFPQDHYQLIWQSYKWKAYERLSVLPRVFLVDNFELIKSDQEIISRLYQPSFDYRNTLILEQDPDIRPGKTTAKKVKIISYLPNSIVIQTKADAPQLLFLSDTYFPGWQAKVDNNKRPIYRANYAFRAVPVEKGSHEVTFSYRPNYFYWGLYLSLGSFTVLVILFVTFLKKDGRH